MFRQSIAQTTNCTCKLLPQGKGQYRIFKQPIPAQKPKSKQIKQKYSLKSKQQATSSNKNQNNIDTQSIKVNSANKFNSNNGKSTQMSKITLTSIMKQNDNDQKISISGNLDSRKKRIIDKNSICSPTQNGIKQMDQNLIFTSKITETQIKPIVQNNFVKTAQAQRNKFQKKVLIRNTHYQLPLSNYMAKENQKIFVSNFNNQTNMNNYISGNYTKSYDYNNINSSSVMNNNNKYQTNQHPQFNQEYYKMIKNPYKQNTDLIISNKQNINIVKKNKNSLNQKNKKIQQNMKNQLCQEVNKTNGQQIELFHESLEKYEKPRNKDRQFRGTFNQYESQKVNKIDKKEFQAIDKSNNGAVQFIQNDKDAELVSYKHIRQRSQFGPNFSTLFTNQSMIQKPVSNYNGKKLPKQSHLNSTLNTVNNQAFKNKKQQQIEKTLAKNRAYKDKYSRVQTIGNLRTQNSVYDQQNSQQSLQENLRSWLDLAQINCNKNKQNSNIQDKKKDVLNENPSVQNVKKYQILNKGGSLSTNNLKFKTNSHIVSNDKIQIKNIIKQNQMPQQKVLLQKLSSFNDIVNGIQCQSILDQSNTSNDQSIVILRYNDLLQKSESQIDCEFQNSQDKYNQQTSILRQLNVNNMYNNKNINRNGIKNKINSLTNNQNQQKIRALNNDTNLKTKKNNKNIKNNNQSNIYMVQNHDQSNNLKKTIKMQKQYLINNFSTNQYEY